MWTWKKKKDATKAPPVKFSHGRTFQLGTLEFLLVDVVYVSTITFRVRSIEESSVERENRGITGYYRGGTS